MAARSGWPKVKREPDSTERLAIPEPPPIKPRTHSSLRAFLPEDQEASRGAPHSVDVRSLAEFTGKSSAPPGFLKPAGEAGAFRVHKKHAVGEAGQRRRYLQDPEPKSRRSMTVSASPATTDHRLLPHWRALEPQLVRDEVSARLQGCQKLRWLLDRVGQPVGAPVEKPESEDFSQTERGSNRLAGRQSSLAYTSDDEVTSAPSTT